MINVVSKAETHLSLIHPDVFGHRNSFIPHTSGRVRTSNEHPTDSPKSNRLDSPDCPKSKPFVKKYVVVRTGNIFYAFFDSFVSLYRKLSRTTNEWSNTKTPPYDAFSLFAT